MELYISYNPYKWPKINGQLVFLHPNKWRLWAPQDGSSVAPRPLAPMEPRGPTATSGGIILGPCSFAGNPGMWAYMDVSKNRVFYPKSSILIGFFIINHPFWGTPIFGNTHIYMTLYISWLWFQICFYLQPYLRRSILTNIFKLG